MNALDHDFADSLHRTGYAVAKGVVDAELVDRLKRLCAQSPESVQARKSASLYGVRHLLNAVPALREIVSRSPFITLVQTVLGEQARPVKGVYFDKTIEANWPVPWHQDVTITVSERLEVVGFEMRPVKNGVVHVLPPEEISQNMVALRIHLDDTGADHGALRVVPGSHLRRLSPTEVTEWLERSAPEVVAVAAGDVMLMRPLLLHASSACSRPDHRRVIHIEYAGIDLPGGLEWAG